MKWHHFCGLCGFQLALKQSIYIYLLVTAAANGKNGSKTFDGFDQKDPFDG